MSFRIHAQEPTLMHETYQHHPRQTAVEKQDAKATITLVEPEVAKAKPVDKKAAPFTIQVKDAVVVNHPAEVPLPAVVPMHDVLSSLAPVHVDRDARSRSPSPAPVPMSEREVVMRIKRRPVQNQ